MSGAAARETKRRRGFAAALILLAATLGILAWHSCSATREDELDLLPSYRNGGSMPRLQIAFLKKKKKKKAEDLGAIPYYSKIVPSEPRKPGESQARMCNHIDSDVPIGQPFPNKTIPSLWALFKNGVSTNPDGPCIEYRSTLRPTVGPFSAKTYREVEKEALMVAYSLKRMGLRKGDRVGIFAKNMPQWSLTQLACTSQGFAVAPIYETIGADAMRHIINHSQARVVFTTCSNLNKLLEAQHDCPRLRHVVLMDDDPSLSEQAPPSRSTRRIQVHSWRVVAGHAGSAGKDSIRPEDVLGSANPAGPEDPCVIMYTSGTTGPPKGVVISNRAFVASIASISRFADKSGFNIGPGWKTLSYLPLAHVFEQTVEAIFFARGASVGYYQGNIKALAQDLKDLKPSVFVGVPQVYGRFIEQIRGGVARAGPVKRALFNLAFFMQRRAVRKGRRSRLWDKLVFGKLQKKLFPKIQFCISGAAPMSAEAQEFIEVVFGCPILQGYGLTETCAGITIQFPGSGYGHCGAILSGAMVKLKDVPEMGYVSNSTGQEQGEILVKGPLLASGYFRDEKKTKEAWDEDGWFASGDIGRFNKDGTLAVVDRKKSMFKLAQGEYVSPENLEAVLSKSSWVKQVWVNGRSSERYVVAIVVPTKHMVKEWATKHRKNLTYSETCQLPAVKQEILESLKQQVAASNLPSFQKPIGVHLETDINEMQQGFTLEKGMLTPTMKYKRAIMQRMYKDEIDQMYSDFAQSQQQRS